MYRLVACVVALISSSHAFPNGAAPSACDNLAPIHGVSAQDTPSPYRIIVDSDVWDSSGSLTVTLTGDTRINGFILQAREKDTGTGIGRFDAASLPTGTKEGPCQLGDDFISVTHADASDKDDDLIFTWNPSGASYQGDINFQGAVAQSQDVFWVGILSADIRMAEASAAGNVTNTDDTDTGTDNGDAGSDTEDTAGGDAGPDDDTETENNAESGNNSNQSGSDDDNDGDSSSSTLTISLVTLAFGWLACVI